MKIYKAFAIILFILVSDIYVSAAKLVSDEKGKKIVVFFSEEDHVGTIAVIKGIIAQTGLREFSTAKERELGQKIQGRTKATARLYSEEEVIPGSVLYIVNDRNLVVAKFTAMMVFKSVSFDRMCTGYGNFRAVKQDYRIVQKTMDSRASEAYLHIARGNYSMQMNDLSEAMIHFEKAVHYDSDNPEAHTGLGYIYLEQKMIPFAIREFDAAYESRKRVYDKEDKYLLLKGCAQARYYAVFYSELVKGNPVRDKYEEQGIRYAKEAAAVYPDSVEANFYLGMFYFDKSTDALTKIETENDVKAVDTMKKVITLKNDHFEAHMVIAKIYKKHGNKDRSLYYVKKAREIDPVNADSRELEKSIAAMK
jgi:tetratricopeptide (TPR) repeat protein